MKLSRTLLGKLVQDRLAETFWPCVPVKGSFCPTWRMGVHPTNKRVYGRIWVVFSRGKLLVGLNICYRTNPVFFDAGLNPDKWESVIVRAFCRLAQTMARYDIDWAVPEKATV